MDSRGPAWTYPALCLLLLLSECPKHTRPESALPGPLQQLASASRQRWANPGSDYAHRRFDSLVNTMADARAANQGNAGLEELSVTLSRLEGNLASLIQSFLALQRSVFNLEQLQELLVLLLEDILKQTGNMDRGGSDTPDSRLPDRGSDSHFSAESSDTDPEGVISPEIDDDGDDVGDDDAGREDRPDGRGGNAGGNGGGGTDQGRDPIRAPTALGMRENLLGVARQRNNAPGEVVGTSATRGGDNNNNNNNNNNIATRRGGGGSSEIFGSGSDENPPRVRVGPFVELPRAIPGTEGFGGKRIGGGGDPQKPQWSEPLTWSTDANTGDLLQARLRDVAWRVTSRLEAARRAAAAAPVGFLRAADPQQGPHAAAESTLSGPPQFEPLEIVPASDNFASSENKLGVAETPSMQVKIRQRADPVVVSHGGPLVGPENFSLFVEQLEGIYRGREHAGERPTGMINNLVQSSDGAPAPVSTLEVPQSSSQERGVPDIRRRRQIPIQGASVQGEVKADPSQDSNNTGGTAQGADATINYHVSQKTQTTKPSRSNYLVGGFDTNRPLEDGVVVELSKSEGPPSSSMAPSSDSPVPDKPADRGVANTTQDMISHSTLTPSATSPDYDALIAALLKDLHHRLQHHQLMHSGLHSRTDESATRVMEEISRVIWVPGEDAKETTVDGDLGPQRSISSTTTTTTLSSPTTMTRVTSMGSLITEASISSQLRQSEGDKPMSVTADFSSTPSPQRALSNYETVESGVGANLKGKNRAMERVRNMVAPTTNKEDVTERDMAGVKLAATQTLNDGLQGDYTFHQAQDSGQMKEVTVEMVTLRKDRNSDTSTDWETEKTTAATSAPATSTEAQTTSTWVDEETAWDWVQELSHDYSHYDIDWAWLAAELDQLSQLDQLAEDMRVLSSKGRDLMESKTKMRDLEAVKNQFSEKDENTALQDGQNGTGSTDNEDNNIDDDDDDDDDDEGDDDDDYYDDGYDIDEDDKDDYESREIQTAINSNLSSNDEDVVYQLSHDSSEENDTDTEENDSYQDEDYGYSKSSESYELDENHITDKLTVPDDEVKYDVDYNGNNLAEGHQRSKTYNKPSDDNINSINGFITHVDNSEDIEDDNEDIDKTSNEEVANQNDDDKIDQSNLESKDDDDDDDNDSRSTTMRKVNQGNGNNNNNIGDSPRQLQPQQEANMLLSLQRLLPQEWTNDRTSDISQHGWTIVDTIPGVDLIHYDNLERKRRDNRGKTRMTISSPTKMKMRVRVKRQAGGFWDQFVNNLFPQTPQSPAIQDFPQDSGFPNGNRNPMSHSGNSLIPNLDPTQYSNSRNSLEPTFRGTSLTNQQNPWLSSGLGLNHDKNSWNPNQLPDPDGQLLGLQPNRPYSSPDMNYPNQLSPDIQSNTHPNQPGSKYPNQHSSLNSNDHNSDYPNHFSLYPNQYSHNPNRHSQYPNQRNHPYHGNTNSQYPHSFSGQYPNHHPGMRARPYPFHSPIAGYPNYLSLLGLQHPSLGFQGSQSQLEPGESPSHELASSMDMEEILTNLFQRYWENVRNLFTKPATTTTPEIDYEETITTPRATSTPLPPKTSTPAPTTVLKSQVISVTSTLSPQEITTKPPTILNLLTTTAHQKVTLQKSTLNGINESSTSSNKATETSTSQTVQTTV